MRGNLLLDKMELVKDEYIEAADKALISHNKRRKLWKMAAIAACICIAIGVAYVGLNGKIGEQRNMASDDTINVAKKNEKKPTETQQTATGQATTEAAEKDRTKIKYSEIAFAQADKRFDYKSVFNGAEMSSVSFDESMLSEGKDTGMIMEGTIKNIYAKEYHFDIKDDKFEKDGVLHNTQTSVVYEIEIEKKWYGDYSENTILIEDENYFCDPIMEMKVGRKYVIPVYKYGDKLWKVIAEKDKYISGDVSRDSIYSTIYQFHPQIEVTADGDYLVSEEWPTLIAGHSRKVIMDTYNTDEDFVRFNMYLIDADTFENQMQSLISKTMK